MTSVQTISGRHLKQEILLTLILATDHSLNRTKSIYSSISPEIAHLSRTHISWAHKQWAWARRHKPQQKDFKVHGSCFGSFVTNYTQL